MLRVTFEDGPSDTTIVKLEGRVVGKFAEAASAAVTARKKPPHKLVIDLSAISFVDEVGEKLLLWLRQIGGEFLAENSYSRFVCEGLQLPIATETVGSRSNECRRS
jgi:hypothetical protein